MDVENVKKWKHPLEARKAHSLWEGYSLQIPCFQPTETDFRFLVPRTKKEHIFVISFLNIQVYDNILQKPQEINTAPKMLVNSCLCHLAISFSS